MVTRFLIPGKTMRKYRSGLYNTRSGAMYVSKGVGVIGVPMRLWCRPEIMLFQLTAAGA